MTTQTTTKSYGRYTSFGDWLFHTLLLNLFLLVLVTYFLGCFDHTMFVVAQWFHQMFDIKAI